MDTQSATIPPAGAIARLCGMAGRLLGRLLGGTSEASVTRRLAGTIFIIRVVSAVFAYLSQILLARWMGSSDYGVYVYVWTWVLLLGSMMDFGISASAQKIIPEYRTRGEQALLRGFLSGSRWMTFIVSSVVSLLLAGLVRLLSPWIDAHAIVPLYIGCLTLPPFVVANTQDGIARSHDWMQLGLMPQFIVRQGLIIGFTAGAFALGFNLGAAVAMLASAGAVWIAMIGQMIVLNRRLSGHIEPGAKAYDFRGWLAVSLPILLVESFYLLLSYTDVLVLQQFRPSDEVGVYFAVVKTLALVSFIHYAMAATTAHRFAEYHALGDKPRLEAYVTHAINWTFWPSLAATVALLAFGKPLLWLFGPQFVGGYDIMFLAAIGLVVRSAIGPVERLLNMLGHQHICALAYALAFVMNVVLCVALVPRFGGYGAAAATSVSLVFETVLLFWIVRHRLGLHVLPFGKADSANAL
jgi:O-antigen/teichoic acid export membrane protein